MSSLFGSISILPSREDVRGTLSRHSSSLDIKSRGMEGANNPPKHRRNASTSTDTSSISSQCFSSNTGSVVILGSRMLDPDEDCEEVDDRIALLFPYNIEIKPPEDKIHLVRWKDQLEEDTKLIQFQDNKNHIAEVLAANDLECDDLGSICNADAMVLCNYIEEIVVSAISDHLMNNNDPMYRNGKLVISSKRIMVGLPSVESREMILRTLLGKEKVENLDFKELAAMTEGYSGSDLKNLCITAAYRPVRELIQKERLKNVKNKERVDEQKKKERVDEGQSSEDASDTKEEGKEERVIVLRPLNMEDMRQYKFFVDGEWRHDEHQPFVSGKYGVVNTVFLAREPDVIPAIYTPETPGRSSMDVDNDPFFHFLGANYLTKAFVIQVGLVDKNKAVWDFWLVLIFAAIGLMIFWLRIVNLIFEYVILLVMMIGY